MEMYTDSARKRPSSTRMVPPPKIVASCNVATPSQAVRPARDRYARRMCGSAISALTRRAGRRLRSEPGHVVARPALPAERQPSGYDRGTGTMGDLYVVFDGDECIGLAATLDDASLVAQARWRAPERPVDSIDAPRLGPTGHGVPHGAQAGHEPDTHAIDAHSRDRRRTGSPTPGRSAGRRSRAAPRLSAPGLRDRVDTLLTRARRRLARRWARRAPASPDQ
jgi:hypothetical protein